MSNLDATEYHYQRKLCGRNFKSGNLKGIGMTLLMPAIKYNDESMIKVYTSRRLFVNVLRTKRSFLKFSQICTLQINWSTKLGGLPQSFSQNKL